jgi:hypothetical protein
LLRVPFCEHVEHRTKVVRDRATGFHFTQISSDVRFIHLALLHQLGVGDDDGVAEGADGKLDYSEFDRGVNVVQSAPLRRLGTNASNRVEYLTRRRNLANPLADVRGAAGRTRAIAAAIRAGFANHEDAASIERRIVDAEFAGHPLTLW